MTTWEKTDITKTKTYKKMKTVEDTISRKVSACL
jgi:hypothetical protein